MTPRRTLLIAATAAALQLSTFLPAAAELTLASSAFGGLRARSIGPAVMSGRIAALEAVPADPLTIYVGAASGGIWKSTNGGVSFKPIFDEHTQSIGALELDPSDPEVIWAGTGESWVRNSVSVGEGVFKSTDGGDTWTHLGLAESERIGKIAVDPSDGRRAFVCATGQLWSANEERGVYRTTDGGGSWEQVLSVDADTGCADLELDPQNPEVVYAGMWQFRRSPDFFTSGGPGSGLYRSTDGGDTWHELTEGLPEGEKGRIAVAVAPSRPSVVYATVEAEETALYRSDNLGESWRKVNTSTNVQVRPFYFSELVVDPKDFDRVYKPGFVLTISSDGGQSFTSMFGSGFGISVHPDHHALWIHPERPNEMLLGTDGGLYASYDRGNHWAYYNRIPISQFYHVSYDMERPYNVYGGLQDNGTWMGPSAGPGGAVRNRHWRNIGFGDGFWAFPDPTDDDVVYVEYQGGQLMRYSRTLGELKDIKPYAEAGEDELRFNWNTPIHLSPNTPGTIYYGSQYLHRSTDRGESWTRISGDLTTDDPAKQRQEESGGLTIDNSTAENHTTIYTISESPKDGRVIWVGTDDGNLQLTRDGGETWTNVAGNVPGLPAGTWVSSVHAGRFDAATAFATFDGHRTGDMATYLYVTRDHGESWQRLAGGETEAGEGEAAVDGYAHVVKQDPVNPDLLYLGTEFGLFLSLDGGQSWARFEENLPRVAVHDLVVHPRDHDLIVGTHGRGIFIIDDVTPLRHLTAEILEANVALLPSRPSMMTITSQIQDFSADDEFLGENPSEVATISYYLKKRHLFGDFKIEIYDQEGELVTTLPGSKRPGLNRVDWPMRLKPPKVPPATSLVPAFVGPRVPEGTYRIKMIKGKEVLEGEIALVPDPRSPHSAEDRALQQEAALDLYGRLEDLTFLVDGLVHLRDGARERAEELTGRTASRFTAFADALEAVRTSIVSTSDRGMIAGEEKLRERMGALYGSVSGYDGRPTDSQLQRLEVLKGELAEVEAKVADLVEKELGDLNALLEKRNLEPIEPLDRAAWEEEEPGTTAAGANPRRLALRLPYLASAALGAL